MFYFIKLFFLDDYIDSIYDVTISYRYQIVKSEIELLFHGNFPKSVHFDIKKYLIKDVINESTVTSNVETQEFEEPIDCSKWLQNIWKQKEERLRLFYSKKDNIDMYIKDNYKSQVFFFKLN